MKRSRWVLAGIGSILAVAVVLLAAAQFALNNQRFSRWLLAEIASRSDGALQVETVSGTLNSGLRIGTLAINRAPISATLESVEFRLDWRSLIARSIVLEYLDIGRLDVTIGEPQASAEASPPASFSLLVLVRLIRIDEASVTLDGTRHSLYDAQTELRLLRNHLELDALSLVYDQATFTGSAALTIADEVAVEADICVEGAWQGETIAGCVRANGNLQALRVNAQTRMPFSATAVGEVELGQSPFFDIAITWQDAEIAAFPDFGSDRGTAQLTGNLERARILAEGELRFQAESATLEGSVVLNAESIEIERLRLEQSGASAEITGVIGRDLSTAQAQVSVRDVDPRRWLPEWPGNLDASATVSVTREPRLTIAAPDVVVRGDLRTYPLTATGQLRYADAALRIEQFRVVSRSDQVTVSGRIADDLELDLDVDASISDIALVMPGAHGSVTAEIEVAGSLERPRIRGNAGFRQLAVDRLSAQALRITGVAGFAADDQFDLAIAGSGLDISGTPVSESVLSVVGTGAAHRLELRVEADDWSATLAGNGALETQVWQGTLERFEFSPGEFGLWQLTEPAEVRYGAGGYSISEMCLSYTLSRICASASVEGTASDALQVEAVNFDVGILAPFLPSDVRARGLVDARGELVNFIADPRGELSLEAADAQIDIVLAEEVFLPVPIEQLSLGALFDESGATLSMSLDAADVGGATAALAVLGNPRSPESRLDGTVNLEWRDAAVLALLSPDVEDVLGRMGAVMSLGGTVAEPVIGGRAQWTDGSLTVPAWALVVDGIAATIESSAGDEALFEATGYVDGTAVTIDGTVLLDPEQGWPMQLRLQGENVSLVQLAGIEVVVTPELEANVQLPRIEVNGRVRIPTAHISDVVLPQLAVTPSADAVIHGRAEEERARPIEMIAALSLELGDDVTIEDANLSASVTGQLDLDYRSGVGAAAEGELTLRGEYVAYGNPLALERGQLIFVGPLDDPSLDIRAVRQFRDVTFGEVTVGAQVNGTLQAPVTTLFSDPSMSEAETLSWLLFGQPLELAREEESRALRNAAVSMGLQQALPVIERFGESLGLDDFSIGTSETDVSALMAGKYLSPNLYFQYSYGLFNRIGGVLLRYRINDRFSLETRSGEHNSMDLLYTREKD